MEAESHSSIGIPRYLILNLFFVGNYFLNHFSIEYLDSSVSSITILGPRELCRSDDSIPKQFNSSTQQPQQS